MLVNKQQTQKEHTTGPKCKMHAFGLFPHCHLHCSPIFFIIEWLGLWLVVVSHVGCVNGSGCGCDVVGRVWWCGWVVRAVVGVVVG